MTRARDLANFVSNAQGDVRFDTDTLFVDSSANRVGIGTTTPSRSLHIAENPAIVLLEDEGGGTNDKKAQLQVDSGVFEINSRNDDDSSLKDNILTAELDTGNIGIGTNSPTGSVHISSSAPTFFMTDTTNNTEGVVSMDNAGSLVFNADLNNEAASSNIRFLVDGTEEVRIDPNGLKFNGDTSADNALNDYEEGTWSPTYGCTSADPTITYSSQIGIYVKVGDLVHIQGRIRTNSVSGGSGSIELKNLPFTSKNISNGFSTLHIGYVNHWPTNHFPKTGYINPGSNTARLINFGSSDPRGQMIDNLTQADFMASGTGKNDFLFSATYRAN